MRGFLGIGASCSKLALRLVSTAGVVVVLLPFSFAPSAAGSDLTRAPALGDPAPALAAAAGAAAEADVAAEGAAVAGPFITSLLKMARSFDGLTFLGQKNAENAHR